MILTFPRLNFYTKATAPILFYGCLISPVHADTLLLQNGDRISGDIQSQTDQSVSIRLPYATTAVQIPRKSVKQIISTHAKAQKAEAKSDPDVLKETDWKLSGGADVDVKITHNSSTTNYAKATNTLEYSDSIWRYALDDSYYYETEDGDTDTHKYTIKPSLDYFFTTKWYWHNSVEYDYNMIADKYLSVDYATGPGYRFWNEKNRRLELTLQGGMRTAYWHDGSDSDDDSSTLSSYYINDHYSYPFVSVGWDYLQPIADTDFTLFSKGTYLKYVQQQSSVVTMNQSLNFNAGIRYKLSEHVHIALGTGLDWDDIYLNLDGHKIRDADNKEWRQTLSIGATF